MSGIAFERVSKVFPDETAAVLDFNLRIHDGEFCVLLGPSGCGKTTALRLAAGLEDLTRGTIRIGDRVVNDVAARDRGIAMVFQSSALYPHLARRGRFDRVRRTAGGLGIAQLLNRRPRQLSEGQRQRAALGRAIVRRPQAFLMDEPLSNLDAKLRVEMRATIARLHRQLGTTVLYVTHDQAEAMALGDRVAVMRDGHLEQVDEPQVLYDRPTTLFVAAFIGSPSMNLWQVRLVEQDGCVVVVCGKQRLVVPEALLTRRKGLCSHVGDYLILGLRPELLAPADSHAAGSVLELPVTLVEAPGPHLLVHLEAEGAGLQLADTRQAMRAGAREGEVPSPAIFSRPAATLTARLPPHTLVKPGQRLRLFVDLERAHFFDPTTQRALR